MKALLAQLDREAPPTRGVWMMVGGHRVRRHTEASAVIYNILRDVIRYEAGKYTFKIEDELRRKGLLRGR